MKPEFFMYGPQWDFFAGSAQGSGGSATKTTAPSVTATRMKGEPIYGIPPVVGHKPGKVLLELTRDAAETLICIGQLVGGDPTSRRGDMDQILQALKSAGVQIPKDYHGRSNYSCISGGLHFKTKFEQDRLQKYPGLA
jgi:hypothetical protein